MQKSVSFLVLLAAMTATSLFADTGNGQKPASGANQKQGQMMMQTPDCSKMSPEEQNFAKQIKDMSNKSMFCSQFTMQQRKQAMQMMGQMDASGNKMNADQAVQQVMQASPPPSTQPRARPGGACPVK